MKTGFWQVLEAGFGVYALFRAVKHHGQLINKPSEPKDRDEKDRKDYELGTTIGIFVAKVVCFLQVPFWAWNAWMGGARGPWFMAYVVASVIPMAWIIEKDKEEILAIRHNVWCSAGMLAVFTALLCAAGFWY